MEEARQRLFSDVVAEWVARRLSPDGREWLAETRRRLAAMPNDRDLFLAVAMTARKVGRDDLGLTPEDMATAQRLREGWRPDRLSIGEATRICLVLTAPAEPEMFARRLDRLCAAADVGELVAYYRGLPLYPDAPRHVGRAAEGVRSNMRSVFEAVAHDNPYAAESFSDAAWNQMVLKALFIGSPLHPVMGLDRRANPALTTMLCDYARERWAARRPVSPELWRCVGRCADDRAMADLALLLRSGDQRERRAAWLALAECQHPQAAGLRSDAGKDLHGAVWSDLAG